MLPLALVLMFTSVAGPSALTDPVDQADPLDRVKCVREPVIGSLTRSRKVCHTLREWNAIRDRAADETARFTQPGWISGEPPEDKIKIEPPAA